MSREIVTVKDLNVFYTDKSKNFFHSGKRIQVLKDVSFSMTEGEILGLVGESGCGKTTLAKAILGMQKDLSGQVIHSTANPQMVFQDPYNSLNPAKKIGWILEEPLKVKGGFTKEDRRLQATEMLHKVGLDEKFLDRYPHQLSGGQRQRICIALALMLKPSLIIADEPVSALDVTIQAQILDLLISIQKEMGLSILFISHDLRLVYKMCDHVMIMQKGQIVEEGDVDTVYFHPQHAYTRKLLDAAWITVE